MGARPLMPCPENRRRGRIPGCPCESGVAVYLLLQWSPPNAEPFGPLGGTATAGNTVQGWRPPAALERVPPPSRAR